MRPTLQKIAQCRKSRIKACVALCLMLAACGSGGGGSNLVAANPPAALSVAISPSSPGVTTFSPAYATTTITASSFAGIAPYTYNWTGIGSVRSAISSATASAPTLSATLNWGDNFTDNWQVTVTDAANHTASAKVAVTFTAPVASGMPAGFSTVPLQGSIVTDSVATTAVPGVSSYPLNIYLPADYATTSDQLPVIYATDGVADQSDPTQYNGWQLPDMARIIEAKGIRAVIVGIGGYERRGTDYLMPGAASYYSFVTTELIPYIEKKYRASPSSRTLSGHSFGGLFVGLALLMDRPANRYFVNFLSLDGSYFEQPNVTTSLLQTMVANSGGNLPNTAFVLSSSSGGNGLPVTAYCQQLQALNIQGWQLTCIPTYDTAHLQMFDEGFSASLDIAWSLAPSK